MMKGRSICLDFLRSWDCAHRHIEKNPHKGFTTVDLIDIRSVNFIKETYPLLLLKSPKIKPGILLINASAEEWTGIMRPMYVVKEGAKFIHIYLGDKE